MSVPDLNDTIVALSSAPGRGGRAIVRLSGPDAFSIAGNVFTGPEKLRTGVRRLYEGSVALPGVAAALPADLYVWPAPRTYTGQQLAELHVLSCPPLVDLVVARFLAAGARAAGPGEFTLRAFLAGKLDLTRAEAILGIIEAANRDQLNQALAQLAGGMARPLQELRSDLLDLLADVEAGLDFVDEDVQFVDHTELLHRVAKGLAMVILLQKQLNQRSVGGQAFRVVLAGRPNAGKSTLFNTLLRRPAALVSAAAGTTRDYLSGKVEMDGVPIELIDTAGRQSARNGVEQQAQLLGQQQTDDAGLILWCHEAARPWTDADPVPSASLPIVFVATKCDLAQPPSGSVPTSAATGAGIDALRQLLAERARRSAAPALAPSWSRCRHHVHTCLDHLRRAHGMILFEEPPELLALELRGALDQLGEMVGAVYTNDLLDRIFSRFCIGK